MHIGPLNTVQYTVIYKFTNNKSKMPASGFRMSQIMFFHISQKKMWSNKYGTHFVCRLQFTDAHGIKKESEIKLFGFCTHPIWGNISSLVICLFTFRGLEACVIGDIQRPHIGLIPSFVQKSHAAITDDNMVCLLAMMWNIIQGCFRMRLRS